MDPKPKEEILGSITKGLLVFEYLCSASEDLGVTEISQALNINKTTIFRILQTYANMGYVDQDTRTQKYRSSMKVLALGNKLLNKMEIRAIAIRYLKNLVRGVQESAHLAILDGYEIVIIDKEESSSEAAIKFHIGRRSPLYCTGLGKVFLASMKDEQVEKYCTLTRFIQHTPQTMTTAAQLKEEIKRIRLQGYAIDRQEHNAGISCVAAAVIDFTGETVAGISITGASFRIESNEELIRDNVITTARAISQALGDDIPHIAV